MIQKKLYSIRMRASLDGKHISGAERIVSREKIEFVVQELIARAQQKVNVPGQINIKIDLLKDGITRSLTALDVMTINVQDYDHGRSLASRLLLSTGVSKKAIEIGITCMSHGAALSGGNMRGAIIMDSQSGERLEEDKERGVRVSRFDWGEKASADIKRKLADIGLTHFRTYEALALATKVAAAPNMVAELCWSDDPDYTAGYVASQKPGYVRFPALKQHGDPYGGRVFFINSEKFDRDAFIRYLQNEAVLIDESGACRTPLEPEEFFREGTSFPKV